MKRKFLEDMGLNKEQVDSIMEENGNDIENAKGETEQLKTELTQTKAQLTERDSQLETLKTASGENESLRQQINDLQEQNKQTEAQLQEQIKNIRLDNAIRAAIGESAQDADLVAGLIDKEKLILGDDGKVTGLEEQVKSLRESKKFLFKEEKLEKPGFHPVGASREQGQGSQETENKPIDMKAAIQARIQSQRAE